MYVRRCERQYNCLPLMKVRLFSSDRITRNWIPSVWTFIGSCDEECRIPVVAQSCLTTQGYHVVVNIRALCFVCREQAPKLISKIWHKDNNIQALVFSKIKLAYRPRNNHVIKKFKIRKQVKVLIKWQNCFTWKPFKLRRKNYVNDIHSKGGVSKCTVQK